MFDCMYAVGKSNLKHNQHRRQQLFAQHGPLECPVEFKNQIKPNNNPGKRKMSSLEFNKSSFRRNNKFQIYDLVSN